MELPVEIIYEIHSYFPFQTYIWCLSKTTRKYWEKRYIDLDNPQPGDSDKIPDMVKIANNTQFSNIDNTVLKARFLIISSCTNHHTLGKLIKNTEWVNLCGTCISIATYRKYPNINFYNYMIYISTGNNSNYGVSLDQYYNIYNICIRGKTPRTGFITEKENIIFILDESDLLDIGSKRFYDKDVMLMHVHRTDCVARLVKRIRSLNIKTCTLHFYDSNVYKAYMRHCNYFIRDNSKVRLILHSN